MSPYVDDAYEMIRVTAMLERLHDDDVYTSSTAVS